MRILFMGHQEWAFLTLEALINSKYTVVGVVAETEKFEQNYSWGEKYHSIKDLAEKNNIPVFQPDNLDEFPKKIEELNPELIVSVSYHKIIKKNILDKWPVINAHNALLPKYRGRAPINWAIINDEKETGVTIHYMGEELDNGDIIVQESVPIGNSDTASTVFKKCLPLYPKLVLQAVDLIESGKEHRIKQDESKASYFPKRKPEDGLIDWNKTSTEIYNWIRALTHPYPGAFTHHNGNKIIIWKSKILDTEKKETPGKVLEKTDEGFVVATGKGTVLVELPVKVGDLLS